jgi:uncharacterized membrane protein
MISGQLSNCIANPVIGVTKCIANNVILECKIILVFTGFFTHDVLVHNITTFNNILHRLSIIRMIYFNMKILLQTLCLMGQIVLQTL